jgi:hypothetical protein
MSTVRLGILNKIVSLLKAIQDPVIGAVELGPLGDTSHTKRYAVGVVPGKETHMERYPVLENNLQVHIEFRITVNKGDSGPLTMAHDFLGVLQNCMAADPSLGGIAIDTQFLGNELDLETFADKSIMGVLLLQVTYRHMRQDFSNPNPSI